MRDGLLQEIWLGQKISVENGNKFVLSIFYIILQGVCFKVLLFFFLDLFNIEVFCLYSFYFFVYYFDGFICGIVQNMDFKVVFGIIESGYVVDQVFNDIQFIIDR